MNILGIESTCDETGVAVVRNGREVLVNLLASSVNLQKKYGGVVPEIAAREQTRVIVPLIDQALSIVPKDHVDAIAVSYGPGLVGSLVIGVESAKVFAYAWQKPLIGVNHLVGHFFANWIGRGEAIKFPAVALIVSGGHTDLLFFKNLKRYQLLGSTLDDAAGEAFDKVSKFLGLGYPGGPEIELKARKFKFKSSNLKVNPFPKPMIGSGDFNFSYSGLKTAVVNHVDRQQTTDYRKEEVCYFFQEAVVDVLVSKTLTAAKRFGAKSIVVGGGVAANGRLREVLSEKAGDLKAFFPEKKFSVDNGAMIGAAAFFQQNFVDPLKLTADSGLHF